MRELFGAMQIFYILIESVGYMDVYNCQRCTELLIKPCMFICKSYFN